MASPHRPAAWPVLVAVHLGIAAVLLTGRLAPIRRLVEGERDGTAGIGRVAARAVVDWYPLIMIPFMYWELPILNTALWGGHVFDLMVQGWEEAVFGGQPAVTFAHDASSMVLSETLHLSYLTYYPILYLFPAIIYVKRSREAFHGTLFAMMLGFTAHYLVYVTFPVKGPYFVFPAPGEPMSSGAFYQAVQFVLATGASAGTAFPSSHVALSTVQTANGLRYFRGAAPVLAVCTVGIALGAVYAGIHYAIDVVIGFGTGAVVAMLAPAVRRSLE